MALSNFIDGTTKVIATWLNKVDVLLVTVFGEATTAAQAKTALGATSTGDALFTAASASAARTTLGATTVGDQMFTAASNAVGRGVIGAAASGSVTGGDLAMSTNRLLGRTTASTGAIEEITVGSGLSFAAGALSATATAVSAATQAEEETATSTTVYTSPGRQHYHPGVAKAWCVFDGTGANGTKTPTASYNLDGTTPVTKNGAGDYTINFGTDFSTANYAIAISSNNSTSATFGCIDTTTATAAGLVRIAIRDAAGAATNSDRISVMAYGDQ